MRRFSDQVGVAGQALAALNDRELKSRGQELRRQLYRSGPAAPRDAQAFALIRETARRTLGLAHYDVQLMGGWAMLRGMLAEMETGEGKTLTATLPACTAALAGIPVHIITVNDYLAGRDAETMRPIYEFLGLSVGTVVAGLDEDSRRAAYACDITYCTNKQVAFDYLRDRIILGRAPGTLALQIERLQQQSTRLDRLLLRGLCFAIVDEADSVLIDEAGTPLVISRDSSATENESRALIYRQALDLAGRLDATRDFVVDTRNRAVTLTATGMAAISAATTGLGDLWRMARRRETWISQALAARHLFRRDHEYLVSDGRVCIIDGFTGRLMRDRNWERGLHQMIEVKEGCAISTPSETLARISYQRFFSRYLHLSGMTGTAHEAAAELHTTYGLNVMRIPTHRPSRLQPQPGRFCSTLDAKWQTVVTRIRRLNAQGRPVLVGTCSVEDSEHLSRLLQALGLEHRVLNARQDCDEAALVAGAGQPGAITVATNMAGRGTDIPLAPGVSGNGGLHVIAVERNDARRIDRQLFGRCARQGDPGSYESILSLEDELPVRYLSKTLRRIAAMCVKGSSPPARGAARVLLRLCQIRSERLLHRQRRELESMDEYYDRMLAFSGRPE